VLDEGSALDEYILHLFESTGKRTELGKQGPQVVVNPPDDQPLDDFDAALALRPWRVES